MLSDVLAFFCASLGVACFALMAASLVLDSDH